MTTARKPAAKPGAAPKTTTTAATAPAKAAARKTAAVASVKPGKAAGPTKQTAKPAPSSARPAATAANPATKPSPTAKPNPAAKPSPAARPDPANKAEQRAANDKTTVTGKPAAASTAKNSAAIPARPPRQQDIVKHSPSSTTAKAAPAKPTPKPPMAPAAAPAKTGPVEEPAVVEARPAPVAVAVPAGEPRPPQAPPRPPMPPGRPIIAPRLPAKAETFAEGDYVVYPTHGVGKVDRIAIEEIAGHRLELIHITFEENRMTLRVPVAKARSAGLRKLANRKMFEEAMAVLHGKARIKRTMWSRRAQEYEAKINSGDPIAIAEVVRDLHRNAGQPDQSFSERQIYEAAMDRLAAELAALDRTDKTTAATKLNDFLKTIA